MTAIIPVGDQRRAALRVPVFGTMGLAAAFLLSTAPVKEEPSLFEHAPWLNDPSTPSFVHSGCSQSANGMNTLLSRTFPPEWFSTLA